MEFSRSKQLIDQAKNVMPAGVNSPVRAFGAVGGEPIYFAKGEGALLTDVDGNTYVDYVCSWGPLILGHCHPDVVVAIEQAAHQSTSYGAPHEDEIQLAQTIIEAMPWIQMLRCVNSGTEASMSAIRLARATTSRDKIIKFEGNYHGHLDSLLVKAGSGIATFSLPDSSGVPEAITRDTLVAPFNHLDVVEEIFSQQGESIAAVIVEPVAGNMGVVPPQDGFLSGLRKVTERYGALLIFDEVITGFRVARSGAAGLYGITPDLVCLGKTIGGGLPVGAYGGRRDLMEQVAPLGPVYQAGTLSGNPLALAAGLATLKNLTCDVYEELERKGALLEQGLIEALKHYGIKATINRVGSMLSVFFSDLQVQDNKSAFSTDHALYGHLFHELIKQGVYLPPSALETWFISAAHNDSQIEMTVAAFKTSLKEALNA